MPFCIQYQTWSMANIKEELDLIRIKNFGSLKNNNKRIRRQATD